MKRLFKNNYFKSLLLLFGALSHPIYSINEQLFYFILFLLVSIFVFVLTIIIDFRYYKMGINNLLEWMLYRLSPPWYQLIVSFIITLIIIGWLGTTSFNNYLPLVIFACWIIPILTVIAVARNIFSLIMKIREMVNESNLFSLGIIILSFFTLIVAFFAPDLAFAFGYSVFINTFYGLELDISSAYYLSLLISHTLPVGEEYTKYISMIAQNKYITYFQIFNVFISKIINWVVIGMVLNYLFIAISSSSKKTNV